MAITRRFARDLFSPDVPRRVLYVARNNHTPLSACSLVEDFSLFAIYVFEHANELVGEANARQFDMGPDRSFARILQYGRARE